MPQVSRNDATSVLAFSSWPCETNTFLGSPGSSSCGLSSYAVPPGPNRFKILSVYSRGWFIFRSLRFLAALLEGPANLPAAVAWKFHRPSAEAEIEFGDLHPCHCSRAS